MFRRITLFSVVLGLLLIVTNSYVRLSGAELACPDWPGCYGQAIIGDDSDFKAHAALAFPDQLLDISKAWKEMSHRYVTAILGLLVFLLALMAWRQKQFQLTALATTLSLLVLIGLLAVSDLWVVKLRAMPVFVMASVLLETLIFWLLFRLYLRTNPILSVSTAYSGRRVFVWFAMLVLFLQIVLGAWLTANHAALVCSGFPQCNDQWWPKADYQNALNLFNGLDTGYTGVISFDAQVAVNWLHRVGALVSFVVLSLLMLSVTSASSSKPLRKAGLLLSFLLFLQISFGVIGYKLNMPLWAVLAHHACSALLMLPLLVISFYSRYGFETAKPVTDAEQQTSPSISVIHAPIGTISEEAYLESEPESLYLRLKAQLKRTRSGLSGVLANLPIGQKEINADILEDIEASLLMADIGINVTTQIISHLTQRLERQQLSGSAALSAALKEELLSILKPCSQPLFIPKQDKPFVILVVGVNGAGKTTTIGKLAKRLQAQGHSVMLAAGDTFRAAAVEQLQTWGERNNIHVVAQHTGADSASVIYDGVQSAQAKGIDVLIADTAGRLHTKSNLMDELKKVKRIITKLDESAPHEVLLVLDAGTGQNALSQAKLFNETVALTGLVLTKLDGTAKGGVIFALAKQAAIPIRYIGIGEGIDDLQDFDAEAFVDALFVND